MDNFEFDFELGQKVYMLEEVKSIGMHTCLVCKGTGGELVNSNVVCHACLGRGVEETSSSTRYLVIGGTVMARKYEDSIKGTHVVSRTESYLVSIERGNETTLLNVSSDHLYGNLRSAEDDAEALNDSKEDNK